ncbi:Sugar carrier protein C-like protein [Drosera capensis]
MPPTVVIAKGDEKGKEYPGDLTWYVIWACLIAGMGGLIFGYDLGISAHLYKYVNSDAIFMKNRWCYSDARVLGADVYKKQKGDISTNQYCKFDSFKLTLFISSLYLAALFASLVASDLTRKLGRKVMMISGGFLFFAGALINALAQNIWMLIVGRILLGVGVGYTNQSVPLYLSEMAPYKYRGALNQFFQLSITIGILIANILNYFFAKLHNGWRYSLGGAMFPALIIAIVPIFKLPETANSLIERGKLEEARSILKKVRGVEDIDMELDDMIAAREASRSVKHPWRNLFQRNYRPQAVMAFLIPSLQQLTGINAIMFYAPVLFKTIGFGNDASLMSAVITGIVNMLSTFVSIYGVDKWGRRALFLEGGTQMLICQVRASIQSVLSFT